MEFNTGKVADRLTSSIEDYDKSAPAELSLAVRVSGIASGEYQREAAPIGVSTSVLLAQSLVLREPKDEQTAERYRADSKAMLGSHEETLVDGLPKITGTVMCGRVSGLDAGGEVRAVSCGTRPAWLATNGKAKTPSKAFDEERPHLITDAVLMAFTESALEPSAGIGMAGISEHLGAAFLDSTTGQLNSEGDAKLGAFSGKQISPHFAHEVHRKLSEDGLDFKEESREVMLAASLLVSEASQRTPCLRALGYATSAACVASGDPDRAREVSRDCGYGIGLLDRATASSASGDLKRVQSPDEMLGAFSSVEVTTITTIRVTAVTDLLKPMNWDDLSVLLATSLDLYAQAGVSLMLDGTQVCLENSREIKRKLVISVREAMDRADSMSDSGIEPDEAPKAARSVAVKDGSTETELAEYFNANPIKCEAIVDPPRAPLYNIEAATRFIDGLGAGLEPATTCALRARVECRAVCAVVSLASLRNVALLVLLETPIGPYVSRELVVSSSTGVALPIVMFARIGMSLVETSEAMQKRSLSLGFSGASDHVAWMLTHHGSSSYGSGPVTTQRGRRARFAGRGDDEAEMRRREPVTAEDRRWELACRYVAHAWLTTNPPADEVGADEPYVEYLFQGFNDLKISAQWAPRIIEAVRVAANAGLSAMDAASAAAREKALPVGPSGWVPKDDDEGSTGAVFYCPQDRGFSDPSTAETWDEFLATRRVEAGVASTLNMRDSSIKDLLSVVARGDAAQRVKAFRESCQAESARNARAQLTNKLAMAGKSGANEASRAADRFAALRKLAPEEAFVRLINPLTPDVIQRILSANLTAAELKVAASDGQLKTKSERASLPSWRASHIAVSALIGRLEAAIAESDTMSDAERLDGATGHYDALMGELRTAWSKKPSRGTTKTSSGNRAADEFGEGAPGSSASEASDVEDDGPPGAGSNRKREASRRAADAARGESSAADEDSLTFIEAYSVSASFGKSLHRLGVPIDGMLFWLVTAANSPSFRSNRYGTTTLCSCYAVRAATTVNGGLFATMEGQFVIAPCRADFIPGIDVIAATGEIAMKHLLARSYPALYLRGEAILVARLDAVHSSMHTLAGGLDSYSAFLTGVFPGRYHTQAVVSAPDDTFLVAYVAARGMTYVELLELGLSLMHRGYGAVHLGRIFQKMPATTSLMTHAFQSARALRIMAGDIANDALRRKYLGHVARIEEEYHRVYAKRFYYGGAAGFASGRKLDAEAIKSTLSESISHAVACMARTRDPNLANFRRAASARRHLENNALEALESGALSSVYWVNFGARMQARAMIELTVPGRKANQLAIEDSR